SDAVAVEHESTAGMEIERGDAFEGASNEQPAAPSEDLTFESDGDQADRHATLRAQELESVDFYIEQGYVDIAVDTLNLLEAQFGKHPDIDRRRTKLAILSGTDSEAAPAPLDNIELVEPADEVPQVTPAVAAQVIDPGLAEIFEEYRASAEGEVNGN